MKMIVYDSENPETLAEHVVCDECRGRAATDERRLRLIGRIAGREVEDRDLEQVERLLDHLFGVRKDRALAAAGFYSETPARRKKIKRQMDGEFGPSIPDPIWPTPPPARDAGDERAVAV
jgi:hypothetical protein